MGELTATDVETYTNGQLSAANPETQRMLDAALTAARRDVRWNVSPIQTGVTITLNGTGTPFVRLPTKQVISLTDVTSDGVALDPVNDVTLDLESGNLLMLNSGIWSSSYNGITVTMDHGYPEDAAAAALIHGYTGTLATDWRQAILSLVANLSQIAMVGRSDYELDSKQIDDVVYRWSANPALGSVEPILAKYRLLYLWM
jgi:hypothetical protein